MKFITSLLLLLFTLSNLNAKEMRQFANELNLYAGTKASVQWERIFSSQRRMQKYHIDTLPQEIKQKLKTYLIEHAADSEQPIVPGL